MFLLRLFLCFGPLFFVASCGGAGASSGATFSNNSISSSASSGSQSSSSASIDPLDWPIEDNVFGTPLTSFTLPAPDVGKGLYYPDLQASFPTVDWDSIDRLYIPAGHYPFIRIGNLPIRTANNRLVITNIDGQVRVGGLGHYYMFVVSGGSNWVLTGRYDPKSETGNINYPGHRGGHFANSQDSYGIMVDDDFVANSVSGLGISNATDFEVEYLEIKEVGFAGMSIKTDDVGDAHMQNVLLHDNYIHDTGSEGLYIGSTQSQPQHKIVSWEIYNNRILRTGTEAIQLGQLAGDNRVHNNVFGPAALDWRDAFQTYQDNNFQIGIREGQLQVYENIFIGSAGSMISLFAHEVSGDSVSENEGITFENNYFDGIRNLGMYINNVSLSGMTYRFERNTFGGYHFQRDEVYDSATEYGHLLRIFNSVTPIEFDANTWFGPANMTNALQNNGVSNNITSTDNINIEPEAVTFVDSGLNAGFEYLNMEMWTEFASLGDDQPVSYEQDDIVTHLGLAYRCSVATCSSGATPPDNPQLWMPVSLADDVRVMPNTRWQSLGIQAQ